MSLLLIFQFLFGPILLLIGMRLMTIKLVPDLTVAAKLQTSVWMMIGICLSIMSSEKLFAGVLWNLLAFVGVWVGLARLGAFRSGPAPIPVAVLEKARRPKRPWKEKLNLYWMFIDNDDDGIYGDDNWRAGREKNLKLAWEWYKRNPVHNLTWYVLGVADRERTVSGEYGNAFHKPGGGFLYCWTDVSIGGIPVSLPFVSYISPHVKAYFGWRPSGAFGPKLNISKAGTISVPK